MELIDKIKSAKDKTSAWYDADLDTEETKKAIISMVLSLPKGEYRYRALKDAIYERFGIMPCNILSRELLLGLTVLYPNKIYATFTHDMNHVSIK